MKKFFFYILFVFLLTVYIYSIVFDAVPISTKILLEAVGLFSCLKYLLRDDYRLKKEYRSIFALIFAIVIWDVITSLLNGGHQYHLVRDMIPTLGSVFGAQLLWSYSRPYLRDCNHFLIIVAITIFAESVLSLLMKASPALYALIDSFLVFDFGSDTITDIYDLTRVFGIGNAHYFGVLASCILGVMTAVYMLFQSDKNLTKALLLMMWFIIAFASFLTARWSVFIVGLSGLLFLFCLRSQQTQSKIGIVLMLLIVGVFVIYFALNSVDSEAQEWAFAYFKDKDSSDHSADIVVGWWENTRFDFKTLLIGDAQYTDQRGGYYMHVDVGFFREIFYGGIIGLLIIIYSHIKILKYTYKYNKVKIFKWYLSFLLLGYFAAMAKGNLNMMTFYILILVFYSGGIFEKKTSRRNNITYERAN